MNRTPPAAPGNFHAAGVLVRFGVTNAAGREYAVGCFDRVLDGAYDGGDFVVRADLHSGPVLARLSDGSVWLWACERGIGIAARLPEPYREAVASGRFTLAGWSIGFDDGDVDYHAASDGHQVFTRVRSARNLHAALVIEPGRPAGGLWTWASPCDASALRLVNTTLGAFEPARPRVASAPATPARARVATAPKQRPMSRARLQQLIAIDEALNGTNRRQRAARLEREDETPRTPVEHTSGNLKWFTV